jgi:hypothetical protein
VNQDSVEIPAVEYNPVIYRLSKNGAFTSEYWLVENRQQIGFDERLPGDGLLIYHIDEDENGNWNDWHPLVFVEQADGRFNLQYRNNNGDAADTWPNGDQARNFHDKTVPDSKYYSTSSSQVGVLNISDSDSIMTADLEVTFSRPWLSEKSIIFRDDAYGNGNMIPEAGEKIQIILSITNDWAAADGIGVTLTTNDTNLIVTVGNADYGTIITGETVNNSQFPFEFQIPGIFASRIDSFFFEVTADEGAYQTTFATEINIGRPQVLIVDDDNGNPGDYENYLIEPVYQQRLPASVWTKSTYGSPDSADLADYYVVMWLTGDSRDNILTSQDISAMKGYLNGGGNLFLTGQELAQQLAVQDPDFLTNYLHCEYIDSTFGSIPVLRPTQGQATASLDSLVVIVGGANNQEVYDHIRPINDGVGEMFFFTMTEDYGAVSYGGAFKVVFFAFGFEAIRNNDTARFETAETIMASIMDFFGEFPTDAEDRDGMAANLPMKFILHQNHPNPFNPVTRISYRINGSGGINNRTILELFNILGQHVVTLVDRIENPGQHSVTWDGTDKSGNAVASGLYFYRLTRDGQSESKKMIFLK